MTVTRGDFTVVIVNLDSMTKSRFPEMGEEPSMEKFHFSTILLELKTILTLLNTKEDEKLFSSLY